jgi:hypothetical protein
VGNDAKTKHIIHHVNKKCNSDRPNYPICVTFKLTNYYFWHFFHKNKGKLNGHEGLFDSWLGEFFFKCTGKITLIYLIESMLFYKTGQCIKLAWKLHANHTLFNCLEQLFIQLVSTLLSKEHDIGDDITVL